MELWYIYTLSDHGKVFYVGISRNVEKRYKGHLGCGDMCTGCLIYWMRHEGRLPILEILHCVSNQQQAEAVETALIRQLCIMGNKLCNVDINPIYNRLIMCTPYPNRERIKRIKNGIVPQMVQSAKDRFTKLSFYYIHEQKFRLQYLGDTASVSE